MNAEHRAITDPSTQVVAGFIRLVQAVDWSPDAVRDLFTRLLGVTRLDHDQRVELAGAMLVTEAVRPYWDAGHDAHDAHARLRERDAEIADVVEALSAVLLGRAEAREEAQHAVEEFARIVATRH